EHHVLLVKEGSNARLHRIVRGDQPARILGSRWFKLAVGLSSFGESLETSGEGGERTGNTAQEQGQTAHQEEIQQESVGDKRAESMRLAIGNRNARNGPLRCALPKQSGDDHFAFGPLRTRLQEIPLA